MIFERSLCPLPMQDRLFEREFLLQRLRPSTAVFSHPVECPASERSQRAIFSFCSMDFNPFLEHMGVSSGGGRACLPWIFIHSTNIVDKGLKVLKCYFSVFFSVPSPLSWKIFCRRPCLSMTRFDY